MKILIVDDEALARDRLRRLLKKIPDCEICGEAGNGREALVQCDKLNPDVMLLDIRMPDMDGMEAARHLCKLDAPPAVIFTTAFGDHALEAFEANATDYLLKPIRKERLDAALDKIRRLGGVQLSDVVSGQAAEPRRLICARVRGDLVLVPFTDVRCFIADSKYVAVEYTDGQVLIEESLKSIEQEYGDQVLRVHRNALVVREHITGLEKDDGALKLRLQGVSIRPEVSRRHSGEVRRLLKRGV